MWAEHGTAASQSRRFLRFFELNRHGMIWTVVRKKPARKNIGKENKTISEAIAHE